MTSEKEESARISEMTDTRRHAWLMIAKIKEIAHTIPKRERTELLALSMAAEKHLTDLTGGIHA